MRLRNKKTGRVFDVMVREKSNSDGEYSIIVCNLRAFRRGRALSSILGEYDSLAKLYEEWEDYEPAEPLIKDPNIRKAVRAWAETIKSESAFVEKPSYERADLILSDNFATISFPIDKPKELDFCKRYTIAELCGEEK